MLNKKKGKISKIKNEKKARINKKNKIVLVCELRAYRARPAGA